MKKFLKSILNGIKYILYPRKTQKIAGMSLLFGLAIFIACFYLSLSSSNWTVKSYVNDSIGDQYFLLTDNKTFTVTGDKVLPTLEYKTDYSGNYLYARIKNLPVNDKYVYDTVLTDQSGKETHVKFVYELDYLEEESSNAEQLIPNEFVGNYIFNIGNEEKVLQIAKTGVGYYNGTELEFVKVDATSSIEAKTDDYKIVLTYVDNKIQIEVNSETVNIFTKEVSSATFKHFDLDKYYHEHEGYNPEKNDLLVIYTRNIVYYLFNRGFTSEVLKDTDIHTNFITMPAADGSLGNDIFDYYLPSLDQEATKDPSTWYTPASRGDVYTVGDTVYQAYNKVTSSMSRLFKYNVPLISYNYIQSGNAYSNIPGTDPVKAVEDFCLYHVVSWGESINYQTSCQKGLPLGVMVPLLCVLFSWIISRRKGNLKLFKEYFNVAAISFIPVALFEFILGFFLQYSIFIFFLVVLQIGVYIFYIYRINTYREVEDTPIVQSNQTLSVEEAPVVKEETSTETKKEDEETPNMIG